MSKTALFKQVSCLIQEILDESFPFGFFGRNPNADNFDYLINFVPSLEMTYALRKLFHIPVGQGRILNIDESLTYRSDEKAKSWGF